MTTTITLHHLIDATTWTIDTDTTAVMIAGSNDGPDYAKCHDCGTGNLIDGLYRQPTGEAVCLGCASETAELILTDEQRAAAARWDAQGIGGN